MHLLVVVSFFDTSSTAQGGGGSFKNIGNILSETNCDVVRCDVRCE